MHTVALQLCNIVIHSRCWFLLYVSIMITKPPIMNLVIVIGLIRFHLDTITACLFDPTSVRFVRCTQRRRMNDPALYVGFVQRGHELLCLPLRRPIIICFHYLYLFGHGSFRNEDLQLFGAHYNLATPIGVQLCNEFINCTFSLRCCSSISEIQPATIITIASGCHCRHQFGVLPNFIQVLYKRWVVVVGGGVGLVVVSSLIFGVVFE
mmetsp:Transcript_22114/g.39783  ORF Transcript_22114/g.39783 Transcript_22114/m.39783 type:complete len:208 (+) Transcript_22114:1420-2043(+)